jgi:tripeptide aminopeptidase
MTDSSIKAGPYVFEAKLEEKRAPQTCEMFLNAKLEREAETVIEAFRSAAAEFGAELDFTKEYAFKSFHITEDHPVVVRARKAAEFLGVKPVWWASGGGLDANVFNEKGLPCIALGIAIEEPHSPKAYIPVARL